MRRNPQEKRGREEAQEQLAKINGGEEERETGFNYLCSDQRILKKATITGHYGFVVEENSVRELT